VLKKQWRYWMQSLAMFRLYRIWKTESDRHQPCSCEEFSYVLQDRPEDRDLDVIVSLTYHGKRPLKHLWEETHVTGHSGTGWCLWHCEEWRA